MAKLSPFWFTHPPQGVAFLEPVHNHQRQITHFRYQVVNPAFAQFLGQTPQELIGQPIGEVWPAGQQTPLFQHLVTVLQTGQSQERLEYDPHRNDWHQLTLTPIEDPELILLTVKPVRKPQQLTLAQPPFVLAGHPHQPPDELAPPTKPRQPRVARPTPQMSTLHEAILRHAGQAILSTDIHGRIQTANQACATLLDCPVGELLGRVAHLEPGTSTSSIPVISLGTAQTNHSSEPFFQRAPGDDQGYHYQECVVIGKKGQSVPVLLAASRLEDEGGTLIGYVGIITDLTASKAAQQLANQQNQALNTFFEGALDMHSICDERGNFSKVNGAFHTGLGYSETELLAIPFLQLIHAQEQKYVYQHLLVTILRQPLRNQINRFRCQDGTYRIFEWNAIGIDEVVYGSARDITERQEAENQLRNLNQRLQLATQATGQGIWEADLELGGLIWDERLWELIGLKAGRSDWTLEDLIQMVHPDDRATFLDRTQQVTYPGSPDEKFSSVCRIIRPDGTLVYMETHGLVVKNAQGHPVRVLGVAWDVTEQKRAEEALRESEQRFRQIADHVDEVFWIHSVEPFHLLYINKQGFWNWSPEGEYEDRPSFMKDIVAEDLPAVQAFFEDYGAGQEGQLDFRLERADGSIRWLSVRTFTIRDGAGHLTRLLGIASDITAQKEKELLLRESLQREQALNQLKSQFVSTASHEFRTPLTTIQSSVDLIGVYLDLPPATARSPMVHHLGIIQKEIKKFTVLLSDLLTIGKIEAGKIVFAPQWTDMVTLSEGLIALHFGGHLFDERRVELLIEGTPRPVYVDEKLMSHVLVNLLSNAFKFSSGAPPRLRIGFEETRVVLAITDTGIGIPAGEIATLFQPFFRASNTVGIQGTGLGLVIARQFVELHRGQLAVASEENKGTTFTICLPAETEGQGPEK